MINNIGVLLMKKYNCINCGKETEWSYQKKNKYCSIPCQQEFQRNERTRQWLEEGKDWGQQMPQWVRHYLTEQRGYACECCGISEWNRKSIVLEVDHIDGHHKNNVPSNLRLICPNCHSQTDTYKAKNTGNGRAYRRGT